MREGDRRPAVQECGGDSGGVRRWLDGTLNPSSSGLWFCCSSFSYFLCGGDSGVWSDF
ncbi:hypothetical protein A2U01_0066385, partial [Trifolium medium]|nr:hypothetical protein [Trifolium medium]